MKTLEQKKQELRDLSNVGDLIAELASDLLLALEALEYHAEEEHQYDIGRIDMAFKARETLNKIIERE